jgi:ubiquinone/menaquinone biosynthesis C-methylase UbiE
MVTRSRRRPGGFSGWRWDLLGQVHGPTLEIGCGWGANFAHYPPGVPVTAFDLAADRLPEAQRAARRAHGRVRVALADAEHLAWPDAAFESVAGTLVFCSIPRPEQALAEVRRVLRPGGRLYLLEHVRSHRPWLAALQDALAPAWLWCTGGCNLNRRTAETVRAAGFEIEQLRPGWAGFLNLIVARPRG